MPLKNNALRLMAFMFFFFSAMTILGTYLPVYLKNIGFSSVELGWLLGIASFASIIAQPFWAYMSDKHKAFFYYNYYMEQVLVCFI
jgi:MFS family permease